MVEHLEDFNGGRRDRLLIICQFGICLVLFALSFVLALGRDVDAFNEKLTLCFSNTGATCSGAEQLLLAHGLAGH